MNIPRLLYILFFCMLLFVSCDDSDCDIVDLENRLVENKWRLTELAVIDDLPFGQFKFNGVRGTMLKVGECTIGDGMIFSQDGFITWDNGTQLCTRDTARFEELGTWSVDGQNLRTESPEIKESLVFFVECLELTSLTGILSGTQLESGDLAPVNARFKMALIE